MSFTPWTNLTHTYSSVRVHTPLVYEGKLGHVIKKWWTVGKNSFFPLKHTFAALAGFRQVRVTAYDIYLY